MARNVRMRAVEPPRVVDWYHLKNADGVIAVNNFTHEWEAKILICEDGSFLLHMPMKKDEIFIGCEIEDVMIKAEKKIK